MDFLVLDDFPWFARKAFSAWKYVLGYFFDSRLKGKKSFGLHQLFKLWLCISSILEWHIACSGDEESLFALRTLGTAAR